MLLNNETSLLFDYASFIVSDEEASSSLNSDTQHILDRINRITITVLYVEMSLCFALNLISFTYILVTRDFRPISCLIMNLVVVDILYSSCIPFYVSQFAGIAPDQTLLGCKLSFFIDATCMIVNVYTVCGLALERFTSIKKTNYEQRVRFKNFLVCIVILWFSASLFVYAKTHWVVLVQEQGSLVHTCGCELSDSSEKIYTILKWIIAFLFPYSVLIITSVRLIVFLAEWTRRARERHRRQHQNQLGMPVPADTTEDSKGITTSFTIIPDMFSRRRPGTMHMRMKRKSTRFVLAVVATFLICWLPMWIYQLVVLFFEYESTLLIVANNLVTCIVYLQGIADPLLYLLLTENFRKLVKSKLSRGPTETR